MTITYQGVEIQAERIEPFTAEAVFNNDLSERLFDRFTIVVSCTPREVAEPCG